MKSSRTINLEGLEARLFLAAQAYDWQNVTMKGTGFINGVVFHPAQPDLIYANTDMGGAYRWDASGEKWTPLTDWIQSTDWSVNYNGAETIAVDPTDPNRVYLGLGTYNGPSSVLRSSDQGRTWLRTNVPFVMNGNGPGRSGGQRMMVDPNAPNIIYYGTRRNGIYRSTDYGASWNTLAGYPFTTDGPGVTQDVGTDWILIDEQSGSPGSASQVIYAGAATTGATKIWRSTNGGTTWAALPGQIPTANNQFPLHGAITPDGNTLYLTYGVNDVGPNGVGGGFVYKVANPDSISPTWTNTTPAVLSQGGWSGVTLDPNNPNTLFASTIDSWGPIDDIYRSTNGGTNWTKLNANNNRDHTSAPYAANSKIHWTGDVQVDPFNPNHVIFNTGFGFYRSTNALATTPTWSFFNDGIEQARVNEIASPASGPVNLLSAIGDLDGFRHVDFAVSPIAGRLGKNQGLSVGSNDDIDVAWNDANYVVRATHQSPYVQYSNDNGVTWAWFPSSGVSGGGSNNGQIAISADGTRAVYEPDGSGQTIYSTRSGSSWGNWTVPATNRPSDGANIVADLVNATTFYAHVGTTLSRSIDGGANWTPLTTNAPGGGTWLRAVPNNAGHLLLGTGSSGLWRSTNGGANWTRINSGAVTVANEVGVGAAAPGQSYPAMFVGGTVNGQLGFHRSDDQGVTWTMISDLAHQYGDVIVIQGDPRVYGRLYVGTNGRGVLYADIHTTPPTLPAGWTSADINSPGSTGAAGESAGTFDIVGGGAGFSGTTDQFRFTHTSLTGDGTITAKVIDVPNGSPNTTNGGATNYGAKVGVMFRSSTAANSANAFIALTPGSVNGVIFQGRASNGANSGSYASQTAGIWPPYWLRLRRVGNQFTAFISPNGTTWSQLGSTQTLSLGATLQVGLAVSAGNNNQLNNSTFTNVSITTPPSVTASAQLFNTSLNKVSFTFNQDVSASLQPGDLTVSPGGFTATSFTWDAGSKTATFSLPPAMLANGDYTATLSGAAIQNAGGDSMASNAPLPFWILPGDANRDRRVNAIDFNALASNFGLPNADTLFEADFNFDGQVNTLDFTALASQFGTVLPGGAPVALGSPASLAASVTLPAPRARTLFSTDTIRLADDIL